MSCDCVVTIAAALWGERSVVWIPVGARYFLLPQGVRFWGPSCLLFNGYRFFFPWGYSCGGVTLPASIAKVMNEWSYATAPPLRPHIVDREKFTFNLSHVYVYRVFIIWRCVRPVSCWTSEVRFAFQACSQCRWLVWFEILRYWDVEIFEPRF